MIKQTIICDRCEKEMVKDMNCVTITINEITGYVRHICPDCKTAFHRFMDNLYPVSPITSPTSDQVSLITEESLKSMAVEINKFRPGA